MMDQKCPKCGGAVSQAYGLAGGGMGSYKFCDTDGCNFFEKTQDSIEAGGNDIVCEQCAVWRPIESVTFDSERAALEHAVDCHPKRLVETLLDTHERRNPTCRQFLESVLYKRSDIA